jgi:hypothetical protein
MQESKYKFVKLEINLDKDLNNINSVMILENNDGHYILGEI